MTRVSFFLFHVLFFFFYSEKQETDASPPSPTTGRSSGHHRKQPLILSKSKTTLLSLNPKYFQVHSLFSQTVNNRTYTFLIIDIAFVFFAISNNTASDPPPTTTTTSPHSRFNESQFHFHNNNSTEGVKAKELGLIVIFCKELSVVSKFSNHEFQ